MGAPSSTWTYRLEATADGAATSVVHTFEHGPGDSFVRRAVERVPATGRNLIAARTAQLQHNMNATLHQVEVQLLRNERS